MSTLSLKRLALLGLVAASLPLFGVRSHGAALIIDGSPVISVLPKDAIPAIDQPVFISVQEADPDFKENEPVLGVRRGQVVRAYSLWQLNHHEIVNDQVGDLSLAITW